MEAAAGVVVGHGVSLPIPSSQSSRKEWRAVSEHSIRNAGSEELEHTNLGQPDERTVYEQTTGPLDVDFCSMTIDENLDNDILQQRLHVVSRRREELQRLEIELRAQVIARSEILDMQNSFDSQIKEHANAATKLQEQLQEREHTLHNLERKMEEKERELRAVKIDNEAAWAKEDLLREQNKELATFRRERDNSEAERAQHLKQMHDLKEHLQEKERQILDLEEQHRIVQENILFKDEQLREAQAWVARFQEMETTNHSLQAELHDRTERFNQFWLGCQRQFADMERFHLQTVQQLQLELAEARERRTYTDESCMSHVNSKDASSFGQNKGNHVDVDGGEELSSNHDVLQNGKADNVPPFVSTDNLSTKTEVPGVPLVPPSLLGMGAYLTPGQVTALHPFIMHQQGVPHPVAANSHIPQSHVGHIQVMPPVSSNQHWQNQQVVSDIAHVANDNQYQPSLTEQNLLRSDTHYDYEISVNGQVTHSDHLDVRFSQGQDTGSANSTSSEKMQGPDKSMLCSTDHLQEQQRLTTEQPRPESNTLSSDTSTKTLSFIENRDNDGGVILPEASVSVGWASATLGKTPEPTLLDERSLLACIVRAIPAGSGGRIRISSTLPNRLGKMIAPLHWHDYKKKYGKLDDLMAGHPELFVIEGDFIQLREGAQEIIAATAAVAKVAAAAAVSAPTTSLLSSIAVTPMAQAHNRLKKDPSIDSFSGKTVSSEHAISTPDTFNRPSQLTTVQNQHPNGICFSNVEGLSNVKILSKPKNPQELNGMLSEIRPGHSNVHIAIGNEVTKIDRAGLGAFQTKGSANGRHGTNSGGKQQGRTTGAAMIARR